MNEFDYLIKQLNLLIGFLDVSDKEVYDKIKNHDQFNMGITIEQLYDKSFKNYLNHITISSFLLGFSHFEDFIAKAITKILIAFPDKNECKVNLKTIKEKGDDLIPSLAAEQARRLIFTDKIKFLEKNLKGLSPEILKNIKIANDIRNCLMHHNGLADERLEPKYVNGQKIIIKSSEVHDFGLQARHLAKDIWSMV
jgi:hypothetical protein